MADPIKTAVVVGGASGIGAAVVDAARGPWLVISALTPQPAAGPPYQSSSA